MIDILPGILEKTFDEVAEKIRLASPYVEYIHIDVADHTLVGNDTFLDFEKLKHFLQGFSRKPGLEAHLMVANPEKYIRPLVDVGFSRLIAHVECQDPRRFIEEANYEEVEIGLSLDGPSNIEELEPFIEEIDMVQIMTIEAGFSGQPFQLETVEKIKTLRQQLPDLVISVDGGMTDKTIPLVSEAGAHRAVVNSFLFANPQGIAETLEHLKRL